MYWLFVILVCLNAHLSMPGVKGEELELPTGQETLTALWTGEGGGEGVGGMGEYGEEGRKKQTDLRNKRVWPF